MQGSATRRGFRDTLTSTRGFIGRVKMVCQYAQTNMMKTTWYTSKYRTATGEMWTSSASCLCFQLATMSISNCLYSIKNSYLSRRYHQWTLKNRKTNLSYVLSVSNRKSNILIKCLDFLTSVELNFCFSKTCSWVVHMMSQGWITTPPTKSVHVTQLLHGAKWPVYWESVCTCSRREKSDFSCSLFWRLTHKTIVSIQQQGHSTCECKQLPQRNQRKLLLIRHQQ